MKILVLNAGSSTQKSCLYDLTEQLPKHPPKPVWAADIDWTTCIMKVKTSKGKEECQLESDDRSLGIKQMLNSLIAGETPVLSELTEIAVVGHRIVHGGTNYSHSVIISEEVKKEIASLIPLAPAHNPAHLEGIEAIEQVLGKVPQVAAFDTAFHTTMPEEAVVYALPYEWYEKGIRRYGFHGISHKYCAGKAAQILNKPLDSLKLINCHLGNGCSLAAIANGISIDTTMGFTPLEGLMMGSRSGSLDPAILIYLMENQDFVPSQLNQMLNKDSGLKGISGISADLRQVVEAMEAGNTRAQLALLMYIHRIKTGIGSMLASLGGLDALIFTAGVGENSSLVREKVCEGWQFIGLEMDSAKNASSPVDIDIASDNSSVRILVVHTEEDWAIAQECWHLLEKT